MAGEIEGLQNALERVRRLEEELKRTADPTQRAAIRERLELAKRDRAEAFKSVQAAAQAGDRAARVLIDALEGWAARQ